MYSLLFAGMLGVFAHHVLFIHGEWHLWAPTLVSIHVISGGLLVAIEVALKGNSKGTKLNALIAISCYLISLSTSIAIYRIYFHRLRHFPGPRLAAATKLWHVWQCRDSRNHLVLEKLRQKYGPFVRTGRGLLRNLENHEHY